MNKLSDDQVTELLAWAKRVLEISEQQTAQQQEALQRLIVLVADVSREQRDQIVPAMRDVLQTIMAIHDEIKQAPSFIRGEHDDAQ